MTELIAGFQTNVNIDAEGKHDKQSAYSSSLVGFLGCEICQPILKRSRNLRQIMRAF